MGSRVIKTTFDIHLNIEIEAVEGSGNCRSVIVTHNPSRKGVLNVSLKNRDGTLNHCCTISMDITEISWLGNDKKLVLKLEGLDHMLSLIILKGDKIKESHYICPRGGAGSATKMCSRLIIFDLALSRIRIQDLALGILFELT